MKKFIWIAVPVVVILVVILLVKGSSKGGGAAGGGGGTGQEVVIDFSEVTDLEAIVRTTRMATDNASLASIKAELMRSPMVDQGKVTSVEDSPDGSLIVMVDVDQVAGRPVPDVTLEISRAKMPAERPTVGQMISFTGRIADIRTDPTMVTVQNPTVGPPK